MRGPFFLLLTGCLFGNPKSPLINSNKTNKPLSYWPHETKSCVGDQRLGLEILDELERYIFSNDVLLFNVNTTEEVIYSLDSPLIFGVEDIKISFETLKNQWESNRRETGEDTQNAIKTAKSFLSLLDRGKRLEYHWCSPPRREQLRGGDALYLYNVFKIQQELERDFNNYENLDRGRKAILREKLVNICIDHHSRTVCEQLYSLYIRQGKGAVFLNDLLKAGVKKQAKYFDKQRKGEIFSCYKQQESIHLRLELKIDERIKAIVSFEKISNEIKRIWQQHGLNLDLVEGDSNSLEIVQHEKNLSYVTAGHRKIYLSNTAAIESIPIVIAHELGHIFGFPDCYVEYYNYETKKLVYYELTTDSLNIMCRIHPNAAVTAKQIQAIIKDNCAY